MTTIHTTHLPLAGPGNERAVRRHAAVLRRAGSVRPVLRRPAPAGDEAFAEDEDTTAAVLVAWTAPAAETEADEDAYDDDPARSAPPAPVPHHEQALALLARNPAAARWYLEDTAS